MPCAPQLALPPPHAQPRRQSEHDSLRRHHLPWTRQSAGRAGPAPWEDRGERYASDQSGILTVDVGPVPWHERARRNFMTANDIYLFLTVPIVTALVGWGTNWAAVKMIFYPEKWVGIGPLGWQGIVYRSSTPLAKAIAKLLSGRLMSAKELASRIDSQALQKFVEKQLPQHSERMVAGVAAKMAPGTWENMAPQMRDFILQEVHKEALKLVDQLAKSAAAAIEELLDVRAMVVKALSGDNAAVLARLFKEIAAQELKFIEYYGGVFGLLIGLIEMVAWGFFQHWWVMPIVGVIVGLVTNWLAIVMIFKPQEPTTYLGLFTYQGLFAKRQAEIARDYGKTTAEEVLTPRALIQVLTEGETGAKLAAKIREGMKEHVDELRQKVGMLIGREVDDAMMEKLEVMMVEDTRDQLPGMQTEFEHFLAQNLDIAKTIEVKLNSLTKSEFEGLLRPLFQQDEWILIVVGGVLGGLVGLLQGAAVLALAI